MKVSRYSIIVAAMLAVTFAFAGDDLLGENRGGGSGSGSSGGSSSGGSSSGGSSGGGKRDDNRGGGSNSGGSSRDNSRNGSSSGGSTRVESRNGDTRQGRSGKVDYRSNSNRAGSASRDGVITVDSSPGSRGSVRDQANRDNSQSRGGSFGNNSDRGYRNGYHQYNNSWNDNDFWYPYYGFNWQPNKTVVSPWYHYTNLPGYISINRVRWINSDDCVDYDWFDNNRDWNWNNRDYRSNRQDPYYYANLAIDDLTAAFSRKDLRALDRIVPRNDWVTIRDQYDPYQLRSDDFYDMVRDLISGTRTRSFRIVQAEDGRGYIRLVAEHRYTDAWRKDRTVYLDFILEKDRRGFYTIAEFTSESRRR